MENLLIALNEGEVEVTYRYVKAKGGYYDSLPENAELEINEVWYEGVNVYAILNEKDIRYIERKITEFEN